MNGQQGNIFDIQYFSVHDGPGIRTNVFLKGCTNRCSWCHNPESISVKPVLEYFPERCIMCGNCFAVCRYGAHVMEGERHVLDRSKCVLCGDCADRCYANALVMRGKTMTVDEVIKAVMRDSSYYKHSGGGVTFSGGEPVMQSAFLLELLKRSKQEGLHTVVQTAGNYPYSLIEPMLDFIDMVMYDIKGFTEEVYKIHVGGDRNLAFDNLKRLDESGKVEIIVRIPVVGSVNDTVEQIEGIAQFLQGLAHLKYFALIPYHSLGVSKYFALGMSYDHAFYTPSKDQMIALERAAAKYVPVFNHDRGWIKAE